jgi:hypothetical protein
MARSTERGFVSLRQRAYPQIIRSHCGVPQRDAAEGAIMTFDSETLQVLAQRARLASNRGDRNEWKMIARIMFAVLYYNRSGA